MPKQLNNRKANVLSNFRYLVSSEKHKSARLIKDEKEVQRMFTANEIEDGDLIVKLTKENLRVAEKHDYIKLT